MSLSGMTGFGRAEVAIGDLTALWEARSVNGRGLDVKIRLPAGREALEPLVRARAQERFRRGSVQVGLTIRREASRSGVRFDAAAFEALIEAARPYVEAGLVTPPSFDGLLLARGVLSGGEEAVAEEQEGVSEAIVAALNDALDALLQARRREGAALSSILEALLGEVSSLVAAARGLAEAQPEGVLEKLRARVLALAPEIQIDPARLAQEAAFLAARGDVREELDRLEAHVAEARTLLAGAEPAGRRLDFLAQELAREANTLSAKVQDLALTRIALSLKTAVDQIKEQAANVE